MPVQDYGDRGEPRSLIARKVVTVTVASGAAAGETDLDNFNGLIQSVFFKVPDLKATNTAELKLQDEDNDSYFASGEKAESDTYNLLLERAVAGTLTVRVETSDIQDADKEFSVIIMYL